MLLSDKGFLARNTLQEVRYLRYKNQTDFNGVVSSKKFRIGIILLKIWYILLNK